MFIAISGKARHGKDLFGGLIAEALFEQTGQCYVLMSFAHEMKTMIQQSFDLSWEQLYGEDKEKDDRRYPKEDSFWTGRTIMQQFGEFYRSIDPNFWIKKLFAIISEKEYDNVIICDGRYKEEIDAVIDKGGYHIRITRDVENKIHGKQHSSETSLDTPYKVDFMVSNNGTLKDLKKLAGDIAGGILQLEKFRN